jgi:hypothetical protein
MDTNEILQAIGAEIARLEQVRALLNRGTSAHVTVEPTDRKPRRRRMSAERARIAAAQKARWAKTKGD